ncbi:alanine racemase [bacterium]|jgi:alanine racemase|nr:alanine racemase [bacterium]
MITWIEINQKNLVHNIREFQKLALQSQIWPVIKSNAYGHGFKEVASILDKEELVKGLMVVNLDEAIELDKIVQKQIIVLSYFDISSEAEESLKIAAEQKIILPVYDLATAEYLNNLGCKFLINIKIDTGTSRLGFRVEESIETIKKIEELKNLEIVSLFTHFAESENDDQTFTEQQLEKFRKISDQFPQYKKHTACSAATLSQPTAQNDIIRLGISLYGLWPSEEIRQRGKEKDIILKPVLSWKTKIIQIKDIKPGETVGYNRTWKCEKDCRLAILPVGYNEGYDRLLSNNAEVIIKGKKYFVRGNVCMNLIMVELPSETDIRVGETVTLLGSNGDVAVSAEDLATWSQTINYETVTRINPKIIRIIVS